MKRSTMTIAALVVATIATGAAAPAMAQDQGPGRDREVHLRGPGGGEAHMRFGGQRGARMMVNRGGERGMGGLFALVCNEDGGDRLQHMLLNIEQRTDPTGNQTALYDTFKAAATSAQADFASACAAARPADDTASLDLPDRLKSRLDVQQAHLDAMNAVLPAFEAFYDSLSDEQKQALAPRRGEHRMDHRGPGAPMGQEGSPQPS